MSIITVPAAYVGQPDATLTIDSDAFGDSYTLTLSVGERIIAQGEGFRPGASSDFGDGEWAAQTCETFGAFLSHALESSDDDARDGWPVLADDASDWPDALTMFGEGEDDYPPCPICGDPIDYCSGHGERNGESDDDREASEGARFTFTDASGLFFTWRGGAYIDVHAHEGAPAADCVNVWDYATDEPTIARTLDAFETRCRAYAREA